MTCKYFKCSGCNNIKPIKEREVVKVLDGVWVGDHREFYQSDMQLCEKCRKGKSEKQDIGKTKQSGSDNTPTER